MIENQIAASVLLCPGKVPANLPPGILNQIRAKYHLMSREDNDGTHRVPHRKICTAGMSSIKTFP